MKRLYCIIGLSVLFGSRAVLATDANWINNGTIIDPPNIDATNVINNGIMGPFLLPTMFDTSNTRNFTNSGTMSGAVGFRFDTAPRNSSGQSIGNRRPAANFHNRISGNISALIGSTISGFPASHLSIEATNLINQGIITVGADGLLEATGTNVNLSRGGFGVLSIDDSAPLTSFNDPDAGLYFPASGIGDVYWGQTNMTFNVDTLIAPNGDIVTPIHEVEAVTPFGGYVNQNVRLRLTDYYYDAILEPLQNSILSLTVTNADGSETNITIFTNEVRQAVFVQLPPNDTTTAVNFEFVPSSQPTNNYYSPLVTLYFQATNVISGQPSVNVVYLQDTLAGEGDRGILANFLTTLGGAGVTQTRRPNPYVLSRAKQGFGLSGNTVIDADFFYPEGSVTNLATDEFAAYSGRLDNILYRPPNIPAGTATNLSGRVEVRAASLDMSRARIRGEGLVSLHATHLVSSSNALVDCENLSLKLGSTNGLLRIQDITSATTDRIQGQVRVWSALWNNQYQLVTESYDTSTNPVVPANITNIINVQNHILVYDASGLASTVPALVQQFYATATNVVMQDEANIVLEFQILANSFTLNGRMTNSGGAADWRYTNAPGLLYFTNNGVLNVAYEAHFGDDGPTPYLTFVNRGTMVSQGQTILSSFVDLGGTNTSRSAFTVFTADGKVENGRINTFGDVSFWAGGLKLNHALINSTGRVFLAVSNALYDNGPASGNTIISRDGFFQPAKAATGDLLGTSFRTVAPSFAQVNNTWAGRDDGVNKSGFVDNGAMGTLTTVADGADPFFVFSGAGTQNGLYVDLLDLSLLSDYANQIQIDPNLTIYYAAAKLSFTPPGNLTPEEFLDGKFDGRVRWVREFTGPNSSVDVVVNGNQTIKVNKALRNSQVIDSDADGVPNYFDATPFDGVLVQATAPVTPPNSIQLSWNAAPGVVYQVDYKNENSTAWQLLTTTTNTSSATAILSVTDTRSDTMRYYRVSYSPNGF